MVTATISINFSGSYNDSLYVYENLNVLLNNDIVVWVYYELAVEPLT
jgi:hypothetical protein